MTHQPVLPASDVMVFPTRVRWAACIAAALVGVVAVVLSADVSGATHPYVMAHSLAAAPYVAGALVFTRITLRACPDEYRPFWQRAFLADITSVLVVATLVVGAAREETAWYTVGGAAFLTGLVLWAAASAHIMRAEAGWLSPSVDLIDAVMAFAVLGAPGALLVVEPLRTSENAVFAAPLAVAAVAGPSWVYLSLVNLSRIPPGRRAAQGLGVGFAAGFMVTTSMHLARVVADIHGAVPIFMAVHVASMSVFMAVPLWAHRQHTAAVVRPTTDDRPARGASPVPYVSAALLPLLAGYVYLTEDQRPWGVPLVGGVLLVVVTLNAVRYSLMTREAERLQSGLARMAEERRRLLADMVRALEDDRRRTATELHAQVVGSLTTLGSMIQTAHVALPAGTATAVKKTFAELQADLRGREEQLRQIMLAMRSPVLGGRTCPPSLADGNPLAAAILAYASELYRGPSTAAVQVEVDPPLELDWITATIAYRIAQEALLNAARHAAARTVVVRVREEDGGVLLEVEDDGRGFDPEGGESGSGIETMRLFGKLGRGQLTLRSTPGQGTLVRALLASRPEREGATASAPSRHLQLVPRVDGEDGGQ